MPKPQALSKESMVFLYGNGVDPVWWVQKPGYRYEEPGHHRILVHLFGRGSASAQLGDTPAAARENMKERAYRLLDEKLSGGPAATPASISSDDHGSDAPAGPAPDVVEGTVKPELPSGEFPIGLVTVSRTGPGSTDIKLQLQSRYNGAMLFASIGEPLRFRRVDQPEEWVPIRYSGEELVMESDTHRVRIYKGTNLGVMRPPWVSPEAYQTAIEAQRTQAQAAAQPQPAAQPQTGTQPAPTGFRSNVGNGAQSRGNFNSAPRGNSGQAGRDGFKNRRFPSRFGR